jgi:hypothetical protein
LPLGEIKDAFGREGQYGPILSLQEAAALSHYQLDADLLHIRLRTRRRRIDAKLPVAASARIPRQQAMLTFVRSNVRLRRPVYRARKREAHRIPIRLPHVIPYEVDPRYQLNANRQNLIIRPSSKSGVSSSLPVSFTVPACVTASPFSM